MRLRNVESVTFTQYSPLFWGAQHADAAHKGRNTSPPNGGILTSAPPCSFEHGAPIFRVTDSLAERDRQDRRPGQCARGRLLTSSFVDPNHRGAVPSRDPPRPPAPRRMFFHPLDARTPWTRPQTFWKSGQRNSGRAMEDAAEAPARVRKKAPAGAPGLHQGVWLLQGVLGVASDPRMKPEWQAKPSIRHWFQIRGRKAPTLLTAPAPTRTHAALAHGSDSWTLVCTVATEKAART